MTFYAYYADWRASQTLKIKLPADHGLPLLELYAKTARGLTVAQSALVLSWFHEMGLPVKTQIQGLILQLEANVQVNADTPQKATAPSLLPIGSSLAFDAKHTALNQAFATVLTHYLATKTAVSWPTTLNSESSVAYLQANPQNVMVKGLLFLVQRLPSKLSVLSSATPSSLDSNIDSNPNTDANQKLAVLHSFIGSLQAEQATLDRAMALVWMSQASSVTYKKIQANTDAEFLLMDIPMNY